jgi:UDP-2-acetamido-2-deoxy-ribo-hexuluronate aminotransferase
MQFIDLKAQYLRISDNIQKRIQDVLLHGKYIMGPEIDELEEKLAQYAGVKHCITVGNGTDALLVAMMALGVKPGDEIITTPFTFIATAEMIQLLGAVPVFVDIDPKTYNIDTTLIEEVITPRTKAIMPVNLYGQCAEYDHIHAIARKHKLAVIEDAAQSFGATYKGKRSCSLGDISCTSFYPPKPLGCYGEGGACFTNDTSLATKLQSIRNHGQTRRYHHPILGLNSRLDTIQAAILLSKLEIFDQELAQRFRIADLYQHLLTGKVITPFIAPGNTCVFAQYTIQVSNRTRVQKRLDEEGIPTVVHYPTPLHQQPVFAGLKAGMSLRKAEHASKHVMSLPFHPYLDEVTLTKIVDRVLTVVSGMPKELISA